MVYRLWRYPRTGELWQLEEVWRQYTSRRVLEHGSYKEGHQRHNGRKIDKVLTFFFSGLVMEIEAIGKSSETGRGKEVLLVIMMAKQSTVMEVSIV